jgi:hypothetical protein
MKLGQTHIILGLVTIFVSIAALFFVFYNLEILAERCKTEESPLCKQLSGFTMSMIVILLMVGGFVITISATVFIMLSAQ